ncbi:hypothetical protein V8G54_025929 [Vigna mungo]|uniref:Uncharacterized protein n=1 Tax=Vigna mungo TaxID=3915 RepID=A0AAQ3MZL8_VIGMU
MNFAGTALPTTRFPRLTFSRRRASRRVVRRVISRSIASISSSMFLLSSEERAKALVLVFFLGFGEEFSAVGLRFSLVHSEEDQEVFIGKKASPPWSSKAALFHT